MPVDSFKYLPRSFHSEYATVPNPPAEAVWAPLRVPIEDATIALVTSAGLYVDGDQEPFDLDRERREPTWGDPTYRVIPRDVASGDIGAAHLHLNSRDLVADFNVALPIRAFGDMADAGHIGAVADHHYSFMGYQERDLVEWRDRYGPEVVAHLQAGNVDAVMLAPA